ncbi:MAG: DUF1566 domain-containing protein [Candidatus Falkowbacteria bacterium]
MKIIPKKLPGSALLISLLILTGIFIIAFGAGYLSFFNTKNTDVYQQSSKARLAAEAGVERMKWEVGVNNFDMYTGCGSRILETNLDDGYYYLKCTLNVDNLPKIQAVGIYKNTSVTLDTGLCYDINTECGSCAIGSLCGGGVLFSVNPLMISAPSGCTSNDGSGCDNSFLTEDVVKMAWDSVDPKVQTNANSTSDGRDNMILLLAGGGRYTAAEYCDRLDVNGFSDWYLPAIDEAYSLVLNSNYCENNYNGGEAVACAHGSNDSPVVGGFVATDAYHTSNEDIDNINYDWLQSFNDGTQAPNGKEKDFFVRCIRRPV